MRTIICGSRSIANLQFVFSKLNGLEFRDSILLVVSGGCRGVDLIGEKWAKKEEIPIRRYIPRWSEEGKQAGPNRNTDMACNADACVCFWDGVSRGTADMIHKAEMFKLKLVVIIYDGVKGCVRINPVGCRKGRLLPK